MTLGDLFCWRTQWRWEDVGLGAVVEAEWGLWRHGNGRRVRRRVVRTNE